MNDKYKISIPHFYCMEYVEGNHKMTIEIDFRESQVFLSSDLIQNWDKPYEKETISFKDKKRIINNIYQYLLKNNSTYRIQLEEE